MFKPAINKWIQKNKKKTEGQKQFLTRVLDEPKLAEQFIQIITKNPRDNKATYRALSRVFTNPTQWDIWQKKYTECYHQFIRKTWNKAKHIEDMLKIIPNYRPWALKDRFGTIQIGKIPNEFGDTQKYHSFLDKIYNSSVMKKYRLFKSLENKQADFRKVYPAVKKIDWFDLDQRGKFLSDTLNKIIGHEFVITHNNHKYMIQYLCNPFSSKMVFQIKSNTKKTYISVSFSHTVVAVVAVNLMFGATF